MNYDENMSIASARCLQANLRMVIPCVHLKREAKAINEYGLQELMSAQPYLTLSATVPLVLTASADKLSLILLAALTLWHIVLVDFRSAPFRIAQSRIISTLVDYQPIYTVIRFIVL